MTTITEKPATIASPDFGLPRLEHPRSAPVSCPKIDDLLAKAAEAEATANSSTSQVEYLRNQARAVGNEISRLRNERDKLAARLKNLENTDIPSHRAACEADIKRLLGIDPLDAIRSNVLNSALTTLPALDAKAKLLPGIIKAVRQELAAVIDELAKLESDGGR
jgi:regulator of replication initiation timing